MRANWSTTRHASSASSLLGSCLDRMMLGTQRLAVAEIIGSALGDGDDVVGIDRAAGAALAGFDPLASVSGSNVNRSAQLGWEPLRAGPAWHQPTRLCELVRRDCATGPCGLVAELHCAG